MKHQFSVFFNISQYNESIKRNFFIKVIVNKVWLDLAFRWIRCLWNIWGQYFLNFTVFINSLLFQYSIFVYMYYSHFPSNKFIWNNYYLPKIIIISISDANNHWNCLSILFLIFNVITNIFELNILIVYFLQDRQFPFSLSKCYYGFLIRWIFKKEHLEFVIEL